jgi:D-amino-acid dehydrogenase
MRIAVLGAGVVGLATAHYLTRNGHSVVVVDRNDGVALETSFANGAQLSYSYVAPLAGPGVLPKIPPWLLRRDAPLRFYPAFDLDQWRWLFEFVRACNRAQSDLTTRRLLALSFYSRHLMHELIREQPIDFGHARNGKLVVYTDRTAFDGARRLVDYQRALGCEQDALDRDACLSLEPALAAGDSRLGRRICGGIHTPSEEVGDCYRFCVGLEHLLMAEGVEFRLGCAVKHLIRSGDRVSGVATDAGTLTADGYVLAAGAQSALLASEVGLRLPVYPLQGYSLTLPVSGASPAVSITDSARKIVYAPLATPIGPALRVAGMADIAGHDRGSDPVRIRQLVAEARAAFPAATRYKQPVERFQPWSGLRPATPKGTPILGATPIVNLYANVGHGALGWTLALGSGRVVADTIAGRAPQVSTDGFRFGER